MTLALRSVRWLVPLTIAILAACCFGAERMDRILFLHLRMQDGAVSLVRSSIRPGRLKTPIASDRQGVIQLQLTAEPGVVLWTEVMADPLCRRLEYVDPGSPGMLRTKWVQVTQAEFTVRLPFYPEGRQLTLHRLERPATRALAATAALPRTAIGTITLAMPEAAP